MLNVTYSGEQHRVTDPAFHVFSGERQPLLNVSCRFVISVLSDLFEDAFL